MGAPSGFFVSSDHSMIDRKWLENAIGRTNFGYGRLPDNWDVALKNSVPFSLFMTQPSERPRFKQIGFARVVTDHATIAWLCDVVIDESYRHQKLGHFLMHQVRHDRRFHGFSMILTTRDAHSFYADFGFVDEMMMISVPAQMTPIGGVAPISP